jgi:hypothetical protein
MKQEMVQEVVDKQTPTKKMDTSGPGQQQKFQPPRPSYTPIHPYISKPQTRLHSKTGNLSMIQMSHNRKEIPPQTTKQPQWSSKQRQETSQIMDQKKQVIELDFLKDSELFIWEKDKGDSIKELLKQGSLAYSEGRYTDAILAWQQILEKEPNNHPDIKQAIEDTLKKIKK